MQIKREVAATGNVTEIYSIHLQSISAVDIYRYYLQKMSAMNIGYLPQCDSPLQFIIRRICPQVHVNTQLSHPYRRKT